MTSYTARITFQLDDESASLAYTFPVVQSVSDPVEGMKATVINGTRADGCIVIPGGKKSQTITVKGILIGDLAEITTAINLMKSEVTTDIGTLTFEYDNGGWQTVWAYTVQRINEITFDESMRTDSQNYTAEFLVLSY